MRLLVVFSLVALAFVNGVAMAQSAYSDNPYFYSSKRNAYDYEARRNPGTAMYFRNTGNRQSRSNNGYQYGYNSQPSGQSSGYGYQRSRRSYGW